eukprot:5732721-Prymnesium_polylepis.1
MLFRVWGPHEGRSPRAHACGRHGPYMETGVGYGRPCRVSCAAAPRVGSELGLNSVLWWPHPGSADPPRGSAPSLRRARFGQRFPGHLDSGRGAKHLGLFQARARFGAGSSHSQSGQS